MFTDHETFIIGFSVSKQHLAVAPEKAGINRFSEEITQAGYDHTKELVRMKWKQEINFSLLERMIEFNIADKAECSTFWRQNKSRYKREDPRLPDTERGGLLYFKQSDY